MNPSPVNRVAYLDHLRVFLTAVVIIVHTAVTYGAPGGWYYFEKNVADLPGLERLVFTVFNVTNQAYFMGFFFLLAGYFTPASLAKKGASAYLRDRLLRLGLPLALFVGLLSPIAIGMAQVMRGGHFIDGFRWVYTGHYECGPLWFVEALLIFALIYAVWVHFFPFRKPKNEKPFPSHVVLFALAALTGVAAFVIRFQYPVGKLILGMQPGYFASYIVLFFAGCHAAHHRWLDRVELKHALPWFAIASLAVATLPVMVIHSQNANLWFGGMNIFAGYYAMFEPFVAWGLILGLLYTARKYLPQTNPFLKHLARCSFAVYVIHAPVLVAMTMLFHGWHADSMVKWIVVAPLTCVACWALASLIIRIPGLRKVF